MGFRFRKSINLGCGVRINLSKSGIGYSFGGRGFRTSISPKGRVTKTFSIPGTGLSYSTSYSINKNKGKHKKSNHSLSTGSTASYRDNGLGIQTNTVSSDIDNFQSAEYSELFLKINKTKSMRESANTFMIAMIMLSVFSPVISAIRDDNSGILIWIIIIAIGIGVKAFVNKNVVVDLDYDMDDESAERYKKYCEAWELINKSKGKHQQISSTVVTNQRINSGVNSCVDMRNFFIDNDLPPYLKTNIQVNVLHLYNETIYLLPDKLLIIKDGKIGAINYDDVQIQYDKQAINSTTMYDDSDKIGETWKYVNNNGSPDRRYKNNYKQNICLCGKISLKSESGLNVVLILSNHRIIDILEK